jgi:hypothetical protein
MKDLRQVAHYSQVSADQRDLWAQFELHLDIWLDIVSRRLAKAPMNWTWSQQKSSENRNTVLGQLYMRSQDNKICPKDLTRSMEDYHDLHVRSPWTQIRDLSCPFSTIFLYVHSLKIAGRHVVCTIFICNLSCIIPSDDLSTGEKPHCSVQNRALWTADIRNPSWLKGLMINDQSANSQFRSFIADLRQSVVRVQCPNIVNPCKKLLIIWPNIDEISCSHRPTPDSPQYWGWPPHARLTPLKPDTSLSVSISRRLPCCCTLSCGQKR